MITTASAKGKGRKLQQHIVSVLLRVFDLEEGDCESRSMGAGGTDVLMSPKARRLIGVSIEAKATRGSPSLAQVKQSRANQYPDTVPGVVWKPHKARYENCLIMFEFEEFMQWVKDMRKDYAK